MPETPASYADTLKRRFAYGDWPRRRGRGALFIWNAALAGDELPGMTMERVKRFETESVVDPSGRPEAARDRLTDAPRAHLQSLWRDHGRSGVLVRVDIAEGLSAADAREKALWLLGEFESPLVERSGDLGDVAFATRGDGLILFVRANLVYLLRNIERRGIALRQAAQALDAAAVGAPDSRRRPLAGITPQARESGPSGTVEATLQRADAGSAERHVCRTFAAPEGEIAWREGAIVYEGPRSGLERLQVFEWRARE
jgi:hypothetical protein